jgi:exopolysaccharide biosynthesis polyprenyl glycosylphosphotransferase
MLNHPQERRPVPAGRRCTVPPGQLASLPGGASRRSPVPPDAAPSGRPAPVATQPTRVATGAAQPPAPPGGAVARRAVPRSPAARRALRPGPAGRGSGPVVAGRPDPDSAPRLGPGSAGRLAPGSAPRLAPGSASRLGPVVAVALLPVADLVALAAAGVIGSGRGAAAAAVLYGLAAFAALWLGGLHRLRLSLGVGDQAGRILAAVALPGLVLLPLLPAGHAVRLLLISAGLVLALRAAALTGLRLARRAGRLTEPALIVGSGTFGAHLAQELRAHPELGLRVAGFLDDGPARRDLAEPVLGRPADLAAAVGRLGIRRVIVSFGDGRDEDLVPVLRACRGLPADVCVVPRLHELGLAVPRGCLDEIRGVPLIPLRRIGLGPAQRGLKRALDAGLAAVLLAAALPVLLVLAAAIAGQTGQSPLFRQRRVTGAGREATVLKLRTITGLADPDTSWTVGDGRITRLGRLLRATHLDELPQLVNVLRGEMSLVGPRPERARFAAQFARQIPRYADRDRMPAGLTGWAQVNGLHGDTSIAERVRFDNAYIEYWSPWLDLVILARTIGSAVAGIGAVR